MTTEACPLCNSVADEYYKTKKRTFFSCQGCRAVFLPERYFVDENAEISRYSQHNNDVSDERYQNFVSPIVEHIMDDFSSNDIGLDFGAGTGPVISKMLTDRGYTIRQYDPYFHNFPELLDSRYDYIACCEVIEHFYDPTKEFELLKNLLVPGGKLFCMTSIYNDNIDFPNWYYKNDPTHVFFYREETLKYIKDQFGFSDLSIKNNLIILSA